MGEVEVLRETLQKVQAIAYYNEPAKLRRNDVGRRMLSIRKTPINYVKQRRAWRPFKPQRRKSKKPSLNVYARN
jgi:hypothetical protein